MGTEKKENLEEMFDRLDQVIGTLEGEDVSLEEAFGLYRSGNEADPEMQPDDQ